MQRITRVAALALVAIAIVLAIVAFGLGRRASRQPSVNTSAPRPAMTTAASQQGFDVVVAAETLKEGVIIHREELRVVRQMQRPSGSFADVAELAGSVPRIDIPAGMTVTDTFLVQGMAKLLKPGERALAVPVDEQAGVGNRVLPGDYVDVFLSLKPPPVTSLGKQIVDGTQTRLLLSHLRVLAYGDQNLPHPQVVANDAAAGDDSKGASSAEKQVSLSRREGPPAVPRTAVLAVPLEDADRLLLGVQNGRLALALRPAGDDSQADRQLFEQPGGVLAVRPDLDADQHQALGQPENRAYAGINGPGLAGLTVSGARSRPNRHERPTGLEIIRGYASEPARDTRKDLP